MIIAGGRDDIDLSECVNEPIHLLGLIQPHGLLLVLEESSLTILQASANAAAMLGQQPLGHPVTALLDPAGRDLLIQTVAGLAPAAAARESRLRLTFVGGSARAFATVFNVRLRRGEGAILLEAEPEYPRGEEAPVDPGSLAPNLEDEPNPFRAAQTVAEVVRQATGYDRVMVYRFLPDWSGEVIAESRLDRLTPYLGLRYPASDIPPQARDLYRSNLVRVIADVAAAPVTLDPPFDPRTGRPPDLGMVGLRHPSLYHVEYLANMGVAATLTISLMVEDALWGLIACHNTTARRLSPAESEAALAVGGRFARLIEARTRDHRRRIAAAADAACAQIDRRLAEGDDPVATLAHGRTNLVATLGAEGMALILGDEVLALGLTPEPEDLMALAARLQSDRATSLLATDHLAAMIGPERSGRTGVCGMAAGVVARDPAITVMVFRGELIHEVAWGGDPRAPAVRSPESGRLTPRRSFALWRETVRDRSAPWSDSALALLEAIIRRLQVWSGDNHRLAERCAAGLAGFAARVDAGCDFATAVLDYVPDNVAVVLFGEDAAGRSATDDHVLFANKAFRRDYLAGAEDTANLASTLARAGLPVSLMHGNEPAEATFTLWSSVRGACEVVARRYPLLWLRTGTIESRVIALTLTDVVRLKRDEAALRAALAQASTADETKTLMMRTVSHEMRTPLNAILGFSQLLLETEPAAGPELQDAYLHRIYEAGSHMLDLINDFLDVARLESGSVALEETEFDLRDPIGDACRWVEAIAAQSRLSWRWYQPEYPIPILADYRVVRQIAVNLLGNAIKFSNPGGEVRCRVMIDPTGDGSLEVSDDGVGIDDGDLARLFRPFGRVETGASPRIQGTGLGLALTKGLIDLHGGRVALSSRRGLGTTVRVVFPRWRLRLPAPNPADTAGRR